MTRRDPYSWTVARLPERELAELVLELAAPLFERLGPSPAADDARAAVALAVSFWNADVLASKLWSSPRVKEAPLPFDGRRAAAGRHRACARGRRVLVVAGHQPVHSSELWCEGDLLDVDGLSRPREAELRVLIRRSVDRVIARPRAPSRRSLRRA